MKNKIKIKTTIFSKKNYHYITWKDLKHIEFQDNDIINIDYVEPICATDYEDDGYFYVEISRFIEETDEQYNQRIIRDKESKEILKQNRYERYLELKKEFEPDNK